MAKIFKFDLDKVSRKNYASPQDADIWFSANQDLLLWMANGSKDGKRLLRLEQTDLERIDEIAVNRVTQHNFVREGLWRPKYRRVLTTDFRVGAKWANTINCQWDWFCELAREFYAKATEKRIVHSGLWNPVASWKGVAYGSTLTAYPDADIETTTFDGTVRRASVDEVWTTIRGGNGTLFLDDQNGSAATYTSASTTASQFSILVKTLALFDTSSLTAGASISAAVLSFVADSKSNNLGSQNFGITSATTAINTGGTNTDYENTTTNGTTRFATDITYASWTADASTYNDFSFNASGLAAISKTGVSKFSLRSNWDIDNSFGGSWSSGVVSTTTINMAENASGTAKAPKFVVTYTVPVGPANVKTYNGIASASVKTINGTAIASVKTWNGIA